MLLWRLNLHTKNEVGRKRDVGSGTRPVQKGKNNKLTISRIVKPFNYYRNQLLTLTVTTYTILPKARSKKPTPRMALRHTGRGIIMRLLYMWLYAYKPTTLKKVQVWRWYNFCLTDWKGRARAKLLAWLKGACAPKVRGLVFFSSLLQLRVDENRSARGDTILKLEL